MSFKRPISASRGSSPHPDTLFKRPRLDNSLKALPEVKLYIVPAKVDIAMYGDLVALAEQQCSRLCNAPEAADVVITAITMRRRFERHVALDIAKTKAVVTPAWLYDSVRKGHALPCEAYVALKDLYEETVENCPSCCKETCGCEDTDGTKEAFSSSSRHCPATPSSLIPESSAVKSIAQSKTPSLVHTAITIPMNFHPPSVPIPTDLSKLPHTARYSCQRASPLICVNQRLVLELDVIKRSRYLEGDNRSALSYSRAIGAIKAYPHFITSALQVKSLQHIGTKILAMTEEFLNSGRVTEARNIEGSERFKALSDFSSIYGIGPFTARRLYERGLRSFRDLELYYDIISVENNKKQLVEIEFQQQSGRLGAGKASRNEVGLGDAWISVALGMREDFSKKIPRKEVEEMNRVVMHELDQIESGCASTIAGGYRRGKPDSNDVDIVFSHPDPTKVKGLCKRLIRRLYEQGMVTHVMHLSNFHGHDPLRTAHWDSLEKALTVFILPPSSAFYQGVRRRLDIIFAQPEAYWCAVVGWSGSIMFQRDLRQWAKDARNMKFDSSGIIRRYDSKEFYPKTEKEVFDLLGLEWVAPEWRNADL